jgi:hypothetical protein
MGGVLLRTDLGHNSNPLPTELVDNNDTFMFGLGTRIRIRPPSMLSSRGRPACRVSIPVVRMRPSASRNEPVVTCFQLNFSDSRGTTIGQIARGGLAPHEWYLGFNLSRKFFLTSEPSAGSNGRDGTLDRSGDTLHRQHSGAAAADGGLFQNRSRPVPHAAAHDRQHDYDYRPGCEPA